MLALSIQQPYAHLILTGVKQFETRTWPTSHHGRILVHAGKTLAAGGLELWQSLPELLHGGQSYWQLRRGAILGSVEVVACQPQHGLTPTDLERRLGFWHAGADGPPAYAWALAHPVVWELPVDWPGQRGLWDIPLDVLPASARRRVPCPS